MATTAESERATYSPKEFAAKFGRSYSWAYRLLYKGAIESITEYGRIAIPATEVQKILGASGRYEGIAKPKRERTKPKERPEATGRVAGKKYRNSKVQNSANPPGPANGAAKFASTDGNARKAALRRLTGRPKMP